MADFRTISMRHVGMTREAMREAVKSRLSIGSQYKIASSRGNEEEKRKNRLTECKLVSFSRTNAVFEHADGMKESFTYQEIWKGLLEGSFR